MNNSSKDLIRDQQFTDGLNLSRRKTSSSPKTDSGKATHEDMEAAETEKAGCNPLNYPAGVYFMLGNEFCERFSYYGMRAILTMYLLLIHKMPSSDVKLVFHTFTAICYFTPILGSILADGFIGRFRVILYVSITYCIGHVLITVGAVPYLDETLMKVLDFSGLFVIAVSTGGIKPCVSAFAADQFPHSMSRQRDQFFSFFYFSINCGALISHLLTPILRSQVKCFGRDNCFPLAFGVPAVLMFLALLIFIFGKRFYVIPQRSGNVIGDVFFCICRALKNSFRRSRHVSGSDVRKHVRFEEAFSLVACQDSSSDDSLNIDNTNQKSVQERKISHEHWLYAASDKYSWQLIEDVRGLLSIMALYIPVVFFWALFDQQGSSWTIQASHMNGRIGYLTVLPDQIGFINPCLVIILVPVFEIFIYPAFRKCNLLVKPLQRMGCGGVLAAASFVIVGFIQLAIAKTDVVLPATGQSRCVILNLANETAVFNTQNSTFSVSAGQHLIHDMPPRYLSFNNKPVIKASFINETTVSETGFFIVIFEDGRPVVRKFALEKAEEGNSTVVTVVYPLFTGNISIRDHNQKYPRDFIVQSNLSKPATVSMAPPGLWGIPEYAVSTLGQNAEPQVSGYIVPDMGGVYGVAIYEDGRKLKTVELVQANSVSLALQIVPYIVITIGEIMFSISGLSFSYSQASPSMKSVLQAVWLTTVAFGNVIDMIISGSHFIEDQAHEFFLYAGLMLVTIAIFMVLAYRYKYVDRDTVLSSQQPNDEQNSNSPGNLNSYARQAPQIKSNNGLELTKHDSAYGSISLVDQKD